MHSMSIGISILTSKAGIPVVQGVQLIPAVPLLPFDQDCHYYLMCLDLQLLLSGQLDPLNHLNHLYLLHQVSLSICLCVWCACIVKGDIGYG